MSNPRPRPKVMMLTVSSDYCTQGRHGLSNDWQCPLHREGRAALGTFKTNHGGIQFF